MPKQKYYVVWKGRRTGIFTTWDACSQQVTGFAGAQYKSFETLAAAESAFKSGHITNTAEKKPAASITHKETAKNFIIPSISVDAACSGVPGPLEWRGVITESGQEIFRFGPMPDGTNNVGEFLAITEGLKWLQQNNLNWPLYSDSTNAILWFRLKKCRTKLTPSAKNARLFGMIGTAETWLAGNPVSNPVLKWDTDHWGENPADFGRK